MFAPHTVPNYENRRFTRVEVAWPVRIVAEMGESLEGNVVDLSVCGLRFTADYPLPVGSECIISIAFDDGQDEIELKASVVSSERTLLRAEIMGIRAGAFDTLRALLVSNTDEPGVIDNEIVSRDRFLPESYE